MKKNITLISLMLGVMLLVGVSGLVSATTEVPPQECALTITSPIGGQWFDNEAVPIEWTLSEGCTPIDVFYLMYEKDGNCNPNTGDWIYVPGTAGGVTQNTVGNVSPYNYVWDKPVDSGQYCIKVKVTSNGARDVTGKFNVDHAKPYVNISSVTGPQIGECTEASGDCYINQQTQIGLECHDDNPNAVWQSGPDYIQYRYSVNGGSFTSWMTYEGAFSFPEDSNHVLEYRCFDKVDKESPTKVKTFIVDSEAPVFNEKTVSEPKVSGCDFNSPNTEKCDWYVNQDTKICVSATLGNQNHPLPGSAIISCEANRWYDNVEGKPEHVEISLDEEGCFSYGEDSYHELHCWATDALGNRDESKDLYEADIVDSAAPITTLDYTGPYYYEWTQQEHKVQWIDTVSRVALTAEDQMPHPVGVDKTYYRVEKVDDSWCYGTTLDQWQETPKSAEDWMVYSEPFGIEESCHAIEYYSVDALGNSEDVNVEFVFSDHSAPELSLSVSASGKNCDNPFVSCEPEWDWKVTTDTEITMSCSDVQPHPSGVKELCYKVTWDGGDVNEEAYYNGGHFTEDGYYCVSSDEVSLNFAESCQHTLDFYCTDNVEKTSNNSITVFKVNGEDFTINLDKKWNLISVPVNLLSSNVQDVFNDSSVEEVWSYENGQWSYYIPGDEDSTLENIVPGRGYWVKTSSPTEIVVGGSLFEEVTGPNSVPLTKGWNLIGHYGTAQKEAYCSLFSLVDTTIGFPRWSSLVGYDSSTQNFEYLYSGSNMAPGQGYWVEVDVDDNYNFATNCWGYPN